MLLASPTAVQRTVLESKDHLIVVGPPGTGKTTIALMKSAQFVEVGRLAAHQSILFLSFSNAAVHRIQETARGRIPTEVLRRLDITTFHGLCYRILAGHRRLAGLGKPFRLLPPEDHANLRSRLSEKALAQELQRLESDEGRVVFDRFPTLVSRVFERAPVIRQAYAEAHPLLLIDEYQDTSDTQDELIGKLVEPGQVVYLGDPEQRIYDWVEGTRADRIERAAAREGIELIVLEGNHRSGSRDIVFVGNAILAGKERIPKSRDVRVRRFSDAKSQADVLKRSIVNVEKYLRNNLPAGSATRIAVMARTNALVSTLSAALLETNETWEYPFRHQVLLNPDAVAIAWDAVMVVLEPSMTSKEKASQVLRAGARLDRLKLSSKSRIAHAKKLEDWAADIDAGDLSRRARGASQLLTRLRALEGRLSPDPREACNIVSKAFRDLPGGHLDQVSKVLDLRPPVGGLADLGGLLGERRSERGSYQGARELAETALLQERMELGSHSRSPRVLMTLHKCKGKQFDAVIIVDGHHGRARLDSGDIQEARRLLRVGITRAEVRAIVLTCVYDPCRLLPRFDEG